jgi:phosphoadenosine phosphosulfate reductase
VLRERQLDGTVYDKTAVAIERIKTMSPIAVRLSGGYTVMVSGGKDSSVITDLAIRSGCEIKFETSWTGLEYPETVYFLRRERERLRSMGYSFGFIIPRDREGKQITMWKLIEKKGLPVRTRRHCCQTLKETAGRNAYCILGIRWAESVKRKARRGMHEISGYELMTNNDNDAKRRMTEVCTRKRKYILNPIIDWSDAEVWEYIRENKLPYNPLYDRGYKRVGCIGCPMVSNRAELEANPRWAALYKKAAFKYIETVCRKHEGDYKDGGTYYKSWLAFCGGASIRQKNITGLFEAEYV